MIFSFFNIINLFNCKKKLWFIIIIFFSFQTFAQKADTTKVKSIDTSKVKNTDTIKVKKHSPKVAAIMSACLPGLGQAYNKKYWKIPIVYAGVGTIAYFMNFNSQKYNTYKKAYQYCMDGDPNTIDVYANKYDSLQLKTLRDAYRRDLELSFIIGAAIYALNIIDASVDAHLYKFDINDNLSLRVSPAFYAYRDHAVTGLSLSLSINNAKKKQLFSKYRF